MNDTSFEVAVGDLMDIAYSLTAYCDNQGNWVEHEALARAKLALPRLRDILALLEYHTTPTGTGEATSSQQPMGHVGCDEPGCGATSGQHDSCMLRFGDRWLCREHHPKLEAGQIRPVGYQPPEAERDALEASRKAVLAKLSRDERRVINTRLV